MPQGGEMRIAQKELPDAPFCHSKAILREATEEPCFSPCSFKIDRVRQTYLRIFSAPFLYQVF